MRSDSNTSENSVLQEKIIEKKNYMLESKDLTPRINVIKQVMRRGSRSMNGVIFPRFARKRNQGHSTPDSLTFPIQLYLHLLS